MNKTTQSLLAFAASIFLFALLFWKTDVGAALSAIAKANPWLVLLGAGLTLVELAVKGLRWKLFIAPYKLSIKTFDIFSVFFASLFVANITPARVGEASRPYFLKKKCGTSFFNILPVVIIERFLDVVVLLVFAAVFLLFSPIQIPDAFKYALLAVIAILFCLFAIILNKKAANWLVSLLSRIFRKKLNVQDRMKSFYEGLAKIKTARLVEIVLLSFACWALDAAVLLVAASSLGVSLDVLFVIGAYSIAVLGGAVSSLPGGLGSGDAILFSLLLLYGLGEVAGLSITLVQRFLTVGIALLFSSAFFYRELKFHRKN